MEYLQDQFQAALDELSNAVAELSETNEKLIAKVQALEEKINKDSHNSNKPPSSDGLAGVPAEKGKSAARKPGGQKGYEGTTLAMVETPAVCAGSPCQKLQRMREVAATSEAGAGMNRGKSSTFLPL